MFKKYPFIQQDNLSDCGYAALAMIIKYYNKYVSLEQIKDSLYNNNGISAYHIIKYAEELGFDARGIRCSYEHLMENKINLPIIMHIENNGYYHYIVVYEIKKEYVLIADPASGIKKISHEELKKQYRDVILTFRPIKIIPYKNNEIKYSNILKNVLNKFKFEFIFIFLISFIITILSIFTSFYLEYMLKISSEFKSKELILLVGFMFIIINFSKSIINFLRSKLLININQKLDFLLTTDIFKNIIKLPYRFYHNRTTGEVVSRINDLGNIRDSLSKVMVMTFIDIFLIVISLFFLFKISYQLTFILLTIVALYILVLYIFHPKFKQLVNNVQVKRAVINTYLYEYIQAFKSVKNNNVENEIIKRFNNEYTSFNKEVNDFNKTYNFQLLNKDLIENIGHTIITLVGVLLFLDNKIEIMNLITFNMLLNYFLEPIKNILEFELNFKESKNALKRIIAIMYYDNEKKLDLELSGNIYLNNLTFSYNDIDKVISNLKISFNFGENTMLLGDSGSGKSTICSLIMNRYKILPNMIKIGDYDINEITNNAIYKYINCISQSETIFTDSIYNNIKLYRNINDEDIKKVCNIVEIEKIYEKSNLGIHSLIEENGMNLSGGEKQRIFLARALLSNSKFLIIDEQLSQLDINSERRILKKIMNMKNKTIILISHRTNNMDLFKRVVMLKKGYIEYDKRRST